MPIPVLRGLQIELVNLCNDRCPLCRTLLRDGVKRRRLSRDELERIVAPVAPQLERVTLYGTRGEPLLHPELEDCVAFLSRTVGAAVDLSTNGSLLDAERGQRLLESGPARVIFAIDGISEATYAHYRVGGDLTAVLRNLETLCDLKRRGRHQTKIVFQLIPMAHNEHEIASLPALARALGVDEVRVKVSSSVTRDRSLRPRDPRHRGGERGSGPWSCPFGLDRLYVDPNGDCFPCCYGEGRQEMLLGNALDTPLTRLWQHPLLQRIRLSFERHEGHLPFCVERCASRPASIKRRLPLGLGAS